MRVTYVYVYLCVKEKERKRERALCNKTAAKESGYGKVEARVCRVETGRAVETAVPTINKKASLAREDANSRRET